MKKQRAPEIAVIILNYNGKKWLEKFLPSVIQHTPTALATIWVADNASTDGSVDFIKNNFKTVNTISFKENLGFAEGYNQAIKNLPCQYVLLLNSDVEVTENWIQPLYNAIKNDRSLAACQPKLLNYNAKDTFEYAGAAGGLIDKYGYPFCRGRIFDHMEKDVGQYDDEIEIFWASGACMLVNRSLFITAGGFDKDFFAHMEEIDLCWRLKNLGYKIKYIPTSTIYHVGGGTLQTQNPEKTFLNYRNNRLLLLKNLRKGTIFRVNLVRNFLDLVSFIMELFKLNFKDAWAIIRAHFAYRKMMLNAFNKRMQFVDIQHRNKIGEPNMKGIYPKSVVFAFFIKMNKRFSQLKW